MRAAARGFGERVPRIPHAKRHVPHATTVPVEMPAQKIRRFAAPLRLGEQEIDPALTNDMGAPAADAGFFIGVEAARHAVFVDEEIAP